MKIGIVASEIGENPAGLERYLYELVSHLTLAGVEHTFNLYVESRLGKLEEVAAERQNVKVVKVGWGKLWKDLGLRLAPKSDVYLFTGPIGPLLFWPKRSVVIAYDFGYKRFGRSLKERVAAAVLDLYSLRSFRSASRVVCISEETARDLKAYFGVAPKKIAVIYPGFNSLPAGPAAERGEKFFLFAGTLKERKNVLNIIKGFEHFISLEPGSGLSLYLVGKYSSNDPYYRALKEQAERGALRGRVRFLGHVSDAELGGLYRSAEALVYPSFLEGFGLPVLEAMAAGLPVITSDKGALKEVAGEAALLVDPRSPEAIGRTMTEVLDEGRRAGLIAKGRKNVRRFSWEKMAEELLKIIDELALDS